MNQKIEWPRRIFARAQRIAGGFKLLEICEREATRQEFLARIRVGTKPVTALSQPLLTELPDDQARAHPLKQLAGEATAHICENVLGFVRSNTGSRIIIGDPLFSSGMSFREQTAAPAPDLNAESASLQILKSFLAVLPDDGLELLATAIASEKERRVSV